MPEPPVPVAEHDDKHRLTAIEGLAALSLDALSSVAYGPEAIALVLATAGASALHLMVPITAAIVVLLAILVRFISFLGVNSLAHVPQALAERMRTDGNHTAAA